MQNLNDNRCFIDKKCGIETWNEITEGTELQTVLSKGNRTAGNELICVPLLQNLHSALRIWDQDSMMNGILTVQRSWSSCKGSIEKEAICGSDHLAHQRTIQSLKRVLQRNRIWFHFSAQGFETKMVPRPFDLVQLDFPEGTPALSALQKELKQVTFPTAQMALTIKVAPNPDVDVHKQRENSIEYSWLNPRTSQNCMIPPHWMVELLEIPDVLLKGFKFIARVSIPPSN